MLFQHLSVLIMAVNHNHLVIMAGGIGSRFWPMSTADKPKQFIDVLGCGRTFIQLTFDRFKGIVPPQNVWVVTSVKYAEMVKQQLPDIPEGNILMEPCRRNTAPCIAYVAWRIKALDKKANLVVTPSDHFVNNEQEFQKVIKDALNFTSASDAIVTLGMKPSRPETGYGYILADMTAPSVKNNNVFRVDSFKEKPDLKTAMQYIKQDDYFWNSGIFIWSVNTIVNALRIYAPEINGIFEPLVNVYGTDEEQSVIDREFPKCPNISVDYAILEKANEIFVYPADFGWSDVGTWGSLKTMLDADDNGNVVVGQLVNLYETQNCLIHTLGEKKVVVQGLDGCIIAENENTLLICKLKEEQRIKQFSGE